MTVATAYPVRVDARLDPHLSRWLWLVKWWLLALPHLLIVGILVGGGAWFAVNADTDNYSWTGGGLIGLLVFIAAIVLAVTGRYPRGLYDFILGLNRWVLRVAAYVSLMTDTYPVPVGHRRQRPGDRRHRALRRGHWSVTGNGWPDRLHHRPAGPLPRLVRAGRRGFRPLLRQPQTQTSTKATPPRPYRSIRRSPQPSPPTATPPPTLPAVADTPKPRDL